MMCTLSFALIFATIFMVSGHHVDLSCECGSNQAGDERIVGGRDASPHQYPWLVAIFNNNQFYCGGSLINDLYVLTAGHCVRWVKQKNIHVVLGMHKRYGTEGMKVSVAKIILHNMFYSHKLYDENDIALIKLQRRISFDYSISPICLPGPDSTYYDKYGIVAGWGRVGEEDSLADYLKYAFVKILSPLECNKTSMGVYVTDNVFCAYNHNTDTCQGDSGGPLLLEKYSGRTEIVAPGFKCLLEIQGIVSWGKGCANPNMPGIYTKVGQYLKWIYSNTRDGYYCNDEDDEWS